MLKKHSSPFFIFYRNVYLRPLPFILLLFPGRCLTVFPRPTGLPDFLGAIPAALSFVFLFVPRFLPPNPYRSSFCFRFITDLTKEAKKWFNSQFSVIINYRWLVFSFLSPSKKFKSLRIPLRNFFTSVSIFFFSLAWFSLFSTCVCLLNFLWRRSSVTRSALCRPACLAANDSRIYENIFSLFFLDLFLPYACEYPILPFPRNNLQAAALQSPKQLT